MRKGQSQNGLSAVQENTQVSGQETPEQRQDLGIS